jgi:hypothetical protein
MNLKQLQRIKSDSTPRNYRLLLIEHFFEGKAEIIPLGQLPKYFRNRFSYIPQTDMKLSHLVQEWSDICFYEPITQTLHISKHCLNVIIIIVLTIKIRKGRYTKTKRTMLRYSSVYRRKLMLLML